MFCNYGFVSAVIFVIDSTNNERLSEAVDELAKLLEEKRLKDALILIYANKQVPFIYQFFKIIILKVMLLLYVDKFALGTTQSFDPSNQDSKLYLIIYHVNRLSLVVWYYII